MSAGGAAGLCQPVERDIYDCYVTCYWPAQVPDHLNNSPNWTSKCASATKDWRNLDFGLPIIDMKQLFAIVLVCACASLLRGNTLLLGGYPNTILVFDEGQGKVVDKIHLETGLPTSMRLSGDRKKVYVVTNDHSGIEVIDVATRKVINHFVLNTATRRYRFNGGTPDPQDKLFTR